MLKDKSWLGDVQENDDRIRSKGVHPKCGPLAPTYCIALNIRAI